MPHLLGRKANKANKAEKTNAPMSGVHVEHMRWHEAEKAY